MSRQPRVVLLTADGLRHRYVASRLAQSTNLTAIVSECKSTNASEPASLPAGQQKIIEKHFAERAEVERRLLGTDCEFPDTDVLKVLQGCINSGEVFERVQRHEPDIVMLYGSGIVRDPLLDAYTQKVINLHLGLSPYYRGSGTNFWPLVDGKPECVGATIHLAVENVDAGAVLGQVRPMAEHQDRAHELGTKTIIAALDCLPVILDRFAQGLLRPQGQDLTQGRVFKLGDFSAEAVTRMWRNLDDGMMSEYIRHQEERCLKYPITSWAEVPVRSAGQ